jgi:hypothetical protein
MAFDFFVVLENLCFLDFEPGYIICNIKPTNIKTINFSHFGSGKRQCYLCKKNTSMFRIFIKINFILLFLSNTLWSQTQPLKIKWQEIYGQLDVENVPIEFIKMHNDDFYLLTNSTSYDTHQDDSLSFRTFSENIINIRSRTIKNRTNRNYFHNENPGRTLFTKTGLLFQLSGPIASASKVTVYKPGIENYINAVNIGIEANGNHKNSMFTDLMEEESGNVSCIGFDDKTNTLTHGEYDILYAKLSPEGNVLSTSRFGGDKDEIVYSFTKVSEYEYVAVGKKEMLDGYLASDFNLYVVKINVKTGQIVWERTYGGTREDQAKKILPLGDGTFYVVGTTRSNDGDVVGYHPFYDRADSDAWILRIDSTGEIIWQKTLGGVFEDVLNDAVLYENNSLLFAGNASVNGNNLAFEIYPIVKSWLLNLDLNGNIIWQKFFSENSNSYGGSIKKLLKVDNKIYFAGVAGHEGDFSSQVGRYWDTNGSFICIGELIKEDTSPSIFIPSLANGRICSNTVMNFNFTTSGVFLPNNQFRIELSDQNGSFSNPVLLKTTINPGNSNLIISDSLPKSPFYKIRVISTSPYLESFVSRRIELINSYAKVTLTASHNSIYPVSNYISKGQKIYFIAKFEGFGPFNIKFSNGSIYQNISPNYETFTEKINSSGSFKITELRNQCGTSQDIEGEFLVKEAVDVCLPQYSDNSYLRYLQIYRNDEVIMNKTYYDNYGVDYLNFCSHNGNKNIKGGDTLKLNLGVSNRTHFKVWLDMNRNNLFEPNEIISSSDTNSVYNDSYFFSYIIPQTISPGDIRLRVTSRYDNVVNSSCVNGNSSDFCLNIIANPTPKITNVSLANYQNYVCEGGTLSVNIDTMGVFEPSNNFKVFISNKDGYFYDSTLIGISNSKNIICTIPNLPINSYYGYKIRVESTHPKVFVNYENSVSYNKIPTVDLGNRTIFIDKWQEYYSVYFQNAGTIPLNFTTNKGYKSSILDSYYNASIPTRNIDTLYFTQLSNACGLTQSIGQIVFKKYEWNQIKIELLDKNGVKEELLNYRSDMGQFNLADISDSLNLRFYLPENMKSYQINSFGVVEIEKRGNVSNQTFLLSNNFLPKKSGIYVVRLKIYGDYDFKNYIGEREVTFEIVDSKSPCRVFANGCNVNPNYLLRNFNIFDRFNSSVLAFESEECNYWTWYYGKPNLTYRFDKTPIFETTRKYSFNVTSGGNNTYQHFYIYIDYNKSGDFSSNELVYNSNTNSFLRDSLSGTFVLPSNIISGKYFMRTFSRTTNASGDILNNFSPCDQYNQSNVVNDFYVDVKNPNCPDNLIVLDNMMGFKYLEVNNSAVLRNKILDNSKVIIDSGKNIVLDVGFETKNNVVFSTLIEGCGNN